MTTNNRFINSVLRWGPALAIMIVIFLASATPSKSMPSFGVVDLLVKKGGHMIGYGLLALSMMRGLQNPSKKGIALAFIITVLYSMSDEFHQSFVAGRGSTWVDCVIDSTGAAIALFAWSKIPLLQILTVRKSENQAGSPSQKIRVEP